MVKERIIPWLCLGLCATALFWAFRPPAREKYDAASALKTVWVLMTEKIEASDTSLNTPLERLSKADVQSVLDVVRPGDAVRLNPDSQAWRSRDKRLILACSRTTPTASSM